MKRFGLGHNTPDPTDPSIQRANLMRQELTPGQFDDLIAAASNRLLASEVAEPETARMAAAYLTKLETRIQQADTTGEGRPITVATVFYGAGTDLREQHGSAAALDFTGNPEGVEDGANADAGRRLAETAMAQVYYGRQQPES